MKQLIYLLLVLSPLLIQAQDAAEKVKTPQIITKLKMGNSITFGTKSIEFIKVTEDSRCPSDVSCVWAGQAKVLVNFYEKDMLLEEKEIIIGANTITPDTTKELFKSGEKSVHGYNLSPYPSSNRKIDPSEYFLELLVK